MFLVIIPGCVLRFHLLVALIGALLLAGCAGSGRARYDSPQEAFEKGKALYDDGKYDRAAEYFQGAFDYGRAHEWADDAQLYLARSYRENKEYLLAANEYTRFIEIYRNDPRVEDAEYERAMTYYARSPRPELDQTPTQQAVDYFRLFINRYPQSARVPEAEARVEELRTKLARKQYETAGLYERRELYEAAAFYYERTFDLYPDTPLADDALVGAMRAHVGFALQSVRERQSERLQPALDIYERLLQIFPESDRLKDAESIYEEARERMRALQEADGAEPGVAQGEGRR